MNDLKESRTDISILDGLCNPSHRPSPSTTTVKAAAVAAATALASTAAAPSLDLLVGKPQQRDAGGAAD